MEGGKKNYVQSWTHLVTDLPGLHWNAASADAYRGSVVINAIRIYVKWNPSLKNCKKIRNLIIGLKIFPLRCVHTASCPAKSVEQLGQATWLSNLKGQVWMISRTTLSRRTRPIGFVIRFGKMVVNVKEKPTDFVVSNFFGRNFCHSLPPPITIARPSNLRYCVFVKHFCKF